MASAAAACAGAVTGLLAWLGPGRAGAAGVDAPPALRATDGGADLLVFVGEKLSVQDITEQTRREREQESSDGVVLLMDGIYRARCRLGHTVDELFEAKQRTVLKARGLFAEPAAP